MIRGLYTSGWSMLANSRKMDVISNNLANVNTAGFKKDTVVFESFPSLLTKRINDNKTPLNPTIGSMQLSSDVGEIFTYYTQGQVVKTEDSFDLALSDANTSETSSPGFFTISVPGENNDSNEYYTRDGSFVLNAYNELVTKEGYHVMGENGIIIMNPGSFSVTESGEIIQNNILVDKLRIAQFSDATKLRKYGDNLVENDGSDIVAFEGNVLQGYTEQSNVNVISEMVDMISVLRAYEANQKILQAQDGTLQKAVTEVGALR